MFYCPSQVEKKGKTDHIHEVTVKHVIHVVQKLWVLWMQWNAIVSSVRVKWHKDPYFTPIICALSTWNRPIKLDNKVIIDSASESKISQYNISRETLSINQQMVQKYECLQLTGSAGGRMCDLAFEAKICHYWLLKIQINFRLYRGKINNTLQQSAFTVLIS